MKDSLWELQLLQLQCMQWGKIQIGLKPMLGGGTAKVKMDFNPRDSLSYVNPEYDYASKLQEDIEKASPLQKDVLARVAELAQSKEAEDLSNEKWQDLIKN